MKTFSFTIGLLLPICLVAQTRDPAPAVAPTANAASTVVTPGNLTEVATNAEPKQLPAKPIALRIVGSNVKNLKGEYLGLIDDVVLNPESKQIEFALLNTEYPTNSPTVTPVPWQLLNYVWDQGQVGGLPGAVQLFRLDVDKGRLAQAPKIPKNQIAELMMPTFRQQLIAFYGNGTENVGGTGTEVATTSGTASGGTTGASTTGAATTTAGTTGTVGTSDGFFLPSPGI